MPQTDQPLRYVGLDHVVLSCHNIEQMLHFYQQVLGCILERVNGNLHHLRAGTSLIDLIPAKQTGSAQNMDHFCLRIDAPDWGVIRTHLAENGVTTVLPQKRYGADGYGLSIYLQDPEGNQLELKGPLSQA